MNDSPPKNPADYVSASVARNFCSFSASALRVWADSGKIQCKRTPGGKRFYYLPDIKALAGTKDTTRHTICYARVSSSKQRDELANQIQSLTQHYPDAIVISDIGSGLNYNRRGFQQLLTQISTGSVDKVVVTYRDRLCRYGIELIDWIFREHNVELVVLVSEEIQNDRDELSRDVLDICNYFVAKYNSRKGAKYRALKTVTSYKENQSQSIKRASTENQASNKCNEIPLQHVCSSVLPSDSETSSNSQTSTSTNS
jgi:predicted site-specific integrase-resolvase